MASSEDYTFDIIKIKNFLTKTVETTKTKKKDDENENLQSTSCKNRLILFINQKYQSFKQTVRNLKEPIQKILTLTDIGTDIRTCYIMYDINPYWYTIMLSAIVTPFIVFWASSYNFKFVVKLRDRADSDSRCINKALSSWITALSLPIVGIILTIIEILGLYFLGLIKRFTPIYIADESNKETYKYKITNFLQKKQEIIKNLEIIKFWNWCLEEFNSGSREFFQICELFFESIPQVILQLWIYMFHSESFTDSSGKPLLTTFDISLSLGAAILNIIINGYEIKNKARAWGLSLSSYIPYFMGSQLNIVKDSCIPVKNWLNTNRYCCDLSHIERFFASKMIKQSNREISKYVDTFENQTNIFKNPKKIVIPLKTNETINNIYEVDIKRTDLIQLLRTLRNAQEKGIIAIDINQFGHTDNKSMDQIFLINKIIISENRLNWDFLKNSSICDNSCWFDNLPIINKFRQCQNKNVPKVPLIEKFVEDLSLKQKLISKLKIIGWADKYINNIDCAPMEHNEMEIFFELTDASRLMWSLIKKLRNKDCCPNTIIENLEIESSSKPFFYNHIQYVSIIAVLFNPTYFYLYQSITTQFYIILSIYGDTRIINKIYDCIKYLRTYEYTCNDNSKEIFSKYGLKKWRTLLYMNNELISKVTQYLSLITRREKECSQTIDNKLIDKEFIYFTRIILHSLIKTIDISTLRKYKPHEYDREPKEIDIKFKGNGRIREMELLIKNGDVNKHLNEDFFKVGIQTYFDVEHRYYHIMNYVLLLEKGDCLIKKPESYLTIDTAYKNRDNVPILIYTGQRTNSTKFIFVKKEQPEVSPDKYEDPNSNYNEYYILTQCRKYFVNFRKVNASGTKKNEDYIEPYLISRKGYIGKSPKNAVVKIIDSNPNLQTIAKRPTLIKSVSKNIVEEEWLSDGDETKVNNKTDDEDETKESVKIDIKE